MVKVPWQVDITGTVLEDKTFEFIQWHDTVKYAYAERGFYILGRPLLPIVQGEPHDQRGCRTSLDETSDSVSAMLQRRAKVTTKLAGTKYPNGSVLREEFARRIGKALS
jgi:hypothetical protein